MPLETITQSIAPPDGGAEPSAIPLGLCCVIGAREPEVGRCATTSGYRLVSLRGSLESAANRLTACPSGRASSLMDARGVATAVKRSDSTRKPQNRIPQGYRLASLRELSDSPLRLGVFPGLSRGK